MTELIFDLLNKIGFSHPLHPAFTHIPMGMIVGTFFFGLTSIVLRKPGLLKTAYHCSVLALVFIPPTIIAGILDWQHSYDGEVEALIILKLILAAVFTVFVGAAVKMGRNKDIDPKRLLIVYVLCLLTAGGLGFSGGELQYG